MKQFILLIILLSCCTFGCSQHYNNHKYLHRISFDSIKFSIWKEKTKETSNHNDTLVYKKKLKEVTLTVKDQKRLLSNIQNKLSFDNTRALIHQNNLVFDLYKNGLISTKITVSTLNGNINIDNQLNNIYFRNKCSDQFGYFILDLLNNYNLIESLNEFDWPISIKNK